MAKDYYLKKQEDKELNNINVQFGNILRKIRENRNMSQEEFADQCNISRAYYGRIERGEHSATLDICKKISLGVDLTLSEIFIEIL